MRTFPGGLATKAACSSEPSRTGFTLDDHTIDDHDGTPHLPSRTHRGRWARTVTFGRLCADCPLRARCTTAVARSPSTSTMAGPAPLAPRPTHPSSRPPTPPAQASNRPWHTSRPRTGGH